MEVLCACEHANVDVFCSDVSENDTGNDDRRKSDTPSDFRDNFAVGRQSWGIDVDTGVSVDYEGGDEVEGYVDGLEKAESLGEFAGVPEFGDE